MLQAFTRSSQTALRCIRPALTCTRAASSKSPNALLSNLDLGTGAPKRATDPSGSPVHWDRLGNVVSGAAKTPDQLWADMDSAPRMPPPTAWAGRSIAVAPGTFGFSLFKLQRVLRNNNVMAEVRRQRRHEKKGEKRRRLRSVRWRRRFAHEVRKKVQLVNQIRARRA